MPEGGTLTVSAHAVGNYVVLCVDDTGTGIPAALIDKIFDPFFTTKEAGKGTGLGLSTSQTIVRSHGGRIEVSSEANRGTRFAIYLPVAPRTVGAAAAGEDAPPPRGSGQTILVVDDEPSVQARAQDRAGAGRLSGAAGVKRQGSD